MIRAVSSVKLSRSLGGEKGLTGLCEGGVVDGKRTLKGENRSRKGMQARKGA